MMKQIQEQSTPKITFQYTHSSTSQRTIAQYTWLAIFSTCIAYFSTSEQGKFKKTELTYLFPKPNTPFQIWEPSLPKLQYDFLHQPRQPDQFFIAAQHLGRELIFEIEEQRVGGAEEREMCGDEELEAMKLV